MYPYSPFLQLGITRFANPEAVVTEGTVRFTVLTPEMIRIEYSPSEKFEDRATFTVVNRNLPVPHFTKSEDNDFLYITTDKLKLRYRKAQIPTSNLTLRVTST